MVRTAGEIESVMAPTTWRVADIYARALLELLEDNDEADQACSQVESVVNLLDGVELFEDLLMSSLLKTQDRLSLVERIFRGRVDERTEGFLAVLTAHDRLGILRAVARRLRELLNQRLGKLEVGVTTAFPLDESELKDVAVALKELLGIEPLIRNEVDPAVLGGMVLKVGDRVYDASLGTELTRLRNRLTSRTAEIPKNRRTP